MIAKRLSLVTLILTVVLGSFSTSVYPASAAAEPLARTSLLNHSQREISFEVNIAWQQLELEELSFDGQSFTQVLLPGTGLRSEPGQPELPQSSTTLAIPFGVTPQLEIVPGPSHLIAISAPVVPAATSSVEYSALDAANPALAAETLTYSRTPDPAFYASAALYPASLGGISNDGVLRQQRLIGVNLYPVRYQPQAGTLLVYESFQVTVRFSGLFTTQRAAPEPESQAFESLYRQSLLNYQEAKAWRLPSADQSPLLQSTASAQGVNSLWTPPSPAWRVKVREDGIYKLTYAELAAAGLDVDHINPQHLQMFYQGSEIAIEVSRQDDESFDLIFYGQALDNKYTADNVYWLSVGSTAGLRINHRSAAPSEADPAEAFQAQMHLESNNIYYFNLPGTDSFERFYWAFVKNAAPLTHSTPYLHPGDGSGSLAIHMYGFTNFTQNPDHHTLVKINDVSVGDLIWEGRTWQDMHVDFPPGTLLEGINSISISTVDDLGARDEVLMVDTAELSWQSSFTTATDSLAFSYDLADKQRFDLAGFSTSDISLFDITEPTQPSRLIDFSVQGSESAYTLSFEEANAGLGQRNYLALSEAQIKTIHAIERDQPSTLQDTLQQADYIILSPSAFWDQAGTLAAFRSSQGLNVSLVNIQDVYDEFNYGIIDVEAIHDFLAYAYNNWAKPAPAYVLLVGDGHYNPKGYTPQTYGALRANYIPPYLAMADPQAGETSADNRYVCIVGDDSLPDMMLGRLAVNSAAEAAAFINKIIAYEQSPAAGDWIRKALIVADNADKGGNFPAYAQFLIANSLSPAYTPQRVYQGITHATSAIARQAVIDLINAGSFIINYTGHGAERQWAGSSGDPDYSIGLLSITDMASLSNNNKFPIIAAMTCKEGYYINPHPVGSNEESLAEVITKAENKGAVASFSPSGSNLSPQLDVLDNAFFKAIFSDYQPDLGQATLHAKLDYWSASGVSDLVDTFLLFGDPATRFTRGLMADDDSYEAGQDELLSVSASEGLLKNDFVPAGQTAEAILVFDPIHGDVNLAGDGSFTYLPDAEYYGYDSFTYKLVSASETSNTVTVSLLVSPRFKVYLPLLSK